MDATALRADRAEVRQTDDEHTLILGAAGVHVMLIRLRHDGWADEVIDSAGTVATWPVNAWTLIDCVTRELTRTAAATFGVPPTCGCGSTSTTPGSGGSAPPAGDPAVCPLRGRHPGRPASPT